MRRAASLTFALAALCAAPAAAQATIASGMTPAQVRATFGDPARVRETDGWTYFFYVNGCPRTCGSDDVVFFQDERVVAAVLHSGARRFNGPGAARALDAVDPRPPAGAVIEERGRDDDGAAVTTIRIRGQSAPGEGMAPARVDDPRLEGERRLPGGSVVVAPSPQDTAGLGSDPDRPLVRGRQMRRVDTPEPLLTDTALDAARIRRERAVTPRTIPATRPGAAPRDSALNQQQLDREKRVVPRVINPPRPSPLTPVPADTARERVPPRE